jgi:hypothetical protein
MKRVQSGRLLDDGSEITDLEPWTLAQQLYAIMKRE